MIISSYNDPDGNVVSLTVDFDENHFPTKYTVSVNYKNTKFPGTKRGAEEAHRYYRNAVSTFEKKNEPKGAAV